MYHAKQNADKNLSSSPSVGTAKQGDTKNTSTFNVGELNVNFKLPTSLTGMTYIVKNLPNDNGSGTSTTAYLSEPKLIAAAKACAQDNGTSLSGDPVSFAAITKVAGTYKDGDAAGESSFLKQLNGFYITVGFPNGTGCSSNDTSLNETYNTTFSNDKTTFLQAFKDSAQAIK